MALKRFLVALAVFALVAFMPADRAAADDNGRLEAVPWVFVGNNGDCGPGTFGSRIVTSAWLAGMGLPDSGGDAAANGVSSTRNDPHTGLLLSKNGPTADCSAAGATIKGATGMTIAATSALGFDYRLGGHCGAGAPRFNVVTRASDGTETFHFVGGCANGVPAPAPQDPLQWARVRFLLTGAATAFPPAAVGERIVSIEIVYDEGTDSSSVSDPLGVGLAVIDNIFVNGQTIRSGSGIAEQHGKAKGKDKETGDAQGDD